MVVSPGDEMSANVTTDGDGDFTLSMTDQTTGAFFTTTQYSSDAPDVSAEVVAEAPTYASSGAESSLADFGTVDFLGCAINGLPISDFAWNQIDMADQDSGATLASTSALGSNGSSFAVATGAVAPTPPAASTSPVTTVAGADASWHNSAVTLTFTATDPGGPGVSQTDYSIDGGSWTVGKSLTIAAPADHANDGTHTIRYSSTDVDGNAELIQTCQVRIDTLGPVCAAKSEECHGQTRQEVQALLQGPRRPQSRGHEHAHHHDEVRGRQEALVVGLWRELRRLVVDAVHLSPASGHLRRSRLWEGPRRQQPERRRQGAPARDLRQSAQLRLTVGATLKRCSRHGGVT